MSCYLWAVIYGLSSLWAVIHGLFSMSCYLCAVICELLSMGCSPWAVVHKLFNKWLTFIRHFIRYFIRCSIRYLSLCINFCHMTNVRLLQRAVWWHDAEEGEVSPQRDDKQNRVCTRLTVVHANDPEQRLVKTDWWSQLSRVAIRTVTSFDRRYWREETAVYSTSLTWIKIRGVTPLLSSEIITTTTIPRSRC